MALVNKIKYNKLGLIFHFSYSIFINLFLLLPIHHSPLFYILITRTHYHLHSYTFLISYIFSTLFFIPHYSHTFLPHHSHLFLNLCLHTTPIILNISGNYSPINNSNKVNSVNTNKISFKKPSNKSIFTNYHHKYTPNINQPNSKKIYKNPSIKSKSINPFKIINAPFKSKNLKTHSLPKKIISSIPKIYSFSSKKRNDNNKLNNYKAKSNKPNFNRPKCYSSIKSKNNNKKNNILEYFLNLQCNNKNNVKSYCNKDKGNCRKRN